MELLAIVFAVQHFRPYLYGRKFLLITDHRPLVWIHNLKDSNSRLGRWKIKLSEYDYDIIYKLGKINSNADALSRNPTDNLNKGNGTSMLLTPGGRVTIGADSNTNIEGMDAASVLEDEGFSSEKIENLVEYVFLSRGIPDTVFEGISSDEEQESDNYDTAPELDTENSFQERRTKENSLRAPLEGVRDPISAHCSITKYGAPAGGKRHSSPGDYNTINDCVRSKFSGAPGTIRRFDTKSTASLDWGEGGECRRCSRYEWNSCDVGSVSLRGRQVNR